MLASLDEACAEVGRDPATIERSILAFAAKPDPLSSVDWFDEYVGAYEAIGIDEITFFWPPFFHPDGEPVPAATVAAFERISGARVTSRPGRSPQPRGVAPGHAAHGVNKYHPGRDAVPPIIDSAIAQCSHHHRASGNDEGAQR